MKKITAFLLALVLVLGLSGCTEKTCYSVDDVYALSNVLKEKPAKLIYVQMLSDSQPETTVFPHSISDLAFYEKSEKSLFTFSFEIENGGSYTVEGPTLCLKYVFPGKTKASLKEIAESYYSALRLNEDTYLKQQLSLGDLYWAEVLIDTEEGGSTPLGDTSVIISVDEYKTETCGKTITDPCITVTVTHIDQAVGSYAVVEPIN